MKLNFVKYSVVYYIFSGILVAGAIAALAIFGLKFGIEFTGGSIWEIEYKDARPSNEIIQAKLDQFNLGTLTIQPTAAKGVIIKMKEIDEPTHQNILQAFQGDKIEEKSFQFIGSSIGQELKQKTKLSIALALLAITLYIAFAFRKSSRPVASWKYGITSLIALFHDIIIPLGVFAVLGHYSNVEITIPIVAALLTILGFSVHDTIVIFDRIRENLLKRIGVSFEDTVNISLNQTLVRSISTVLAVLIVLFAIFFFGGETLKYFALALIIGITSGAYSSIFVATPLLVSWRHLDARKSK